ncbi:pectinesterase family protein [Roseateles violae]|uniref:Pectinesterase n=1 Tax=Roseateles violae TaxID=3058042 RepID=A0ABT8DSH9_9BURK|nr:pectinesterase family protein [Pelomonas sp. PFR6]MDN3921281.1 pectinesterase family protein [Pelomonas sp. PFR6]
MRLAAAALALAWAVTLPSQAQQRPQLSDAEAARQTVADYLGDWTPAPLDTSAWRADFVVAADGSGTHRSLQAALAAVPASGRRHYIRIEPGIYREQICLRDKAPVSLWGAGRDAAAVLIVEGHYNAEPQGANPCVAGSAPAGSVGTAGSASVALFGNDIVLANLSIANDALERVRTGLGYPPGAGETGGAQAVALLTEGDRIQLENVRLLGHQDTFYARGTGRVFVRASLIAGDVDFIFGNATLVIAESTILSRAGRRQPGQDGHVLAPSTAPTQRLGFLITGSRLIAEPGVPAGAISLGRAWDQGVPKGQWDAGRSPNGQALIRDSRLGPHLGPWAASTSRRPFSAAGNRLTEYRNGPLDPAEPGAAAEKTD